ncbi:MAG: hypothetical protein PVF58_10010 [Candidatus Methanofastidiosia archaeon]|jgi:hypothetical protein
MPVSGEISVPPGPDVLKDRASFWISHTKNFFERTQMVCIHFKNEKSPLYTCCAYRIDEAMNFLIDAENFYSDKEYKAAYDSAVKALYCLEQIYECYQGNIFVV